MTGAWLLASCLALGTAATAVTLVAPAFFVSVFLAHSDRSASATAVVAIANSAAAGYVVLLNFIMVARHHERAVPPAFAVGAAVTLASGVAVVISRPGLESFWTAAALTAGLTVTAALLNAQRGTARPRARALVGRLHRRAHGIRRRRDCRGTCLFTTPAAGARARRSRRGAPPLDDPRVSRRTARTLKHRV